MITKTNFKDLLETLGFMQDGNIFQKSIGEADLTVDFGQQRLIYPEGLKINRQDTCNFAQPENFVVFECIHRLLDKGYKPDHLELEPTWQVGRGASGGRADILVRDHEKNPLLIIECKTAGGEFDRAWRKTQQDGDQLFSYAQQIRRTQYLCLYASDFVENNIRIDQRIISHRDDENILAQNRTSMSFAEAADVEDRYTVWRETYQLESAESGIFEDNVQAYQIGKNKYSLAEDTKVIDAVDKEGKYHQFRTILRKHNIARRENAFEVLVNLFLSKLVDEEENQIDLQFYWKGITYDNYFDFVDRLQNLYQKGMRKFLNEKISYISNEQIDNAFWTVKNKRNATKQQIQRYFRELKFFTNSAFSFLDTHNEELFKRNTKVLSEVVQMWQGLRLKAEVPNQFLGDMFEMFLDDGVKQSEGQFFTPLPICKFIVASLPLARKIRENSEPLNAIDYACGSGHFLNEYAHQIKPLVEASGGNLSDYYSQIIGIEKEDRLAKVAKVAAYMHGQEQIKILDADALGSHPEVQPESYDVLVANPPFAVEGFLQTLNENDKKAYQLIQATSENSNTKNIECFFLERIHHLMALGGVVGVIVPSSILNTVDAVHTSTREILLQFFDLVSIAELGSGTFGKTGTNTVVLFLRRKAQQPETSEHYRNRVDDFFEGDRESEEYQDDYVIKAYCEHIEVPYAEYIKLFAQTSRKQLANLLKYDIFKDYQQAFDKSTEIKNLKKSTVFKRKTTMEQSAELDQRFITYLHKIEKEKLYYFILAHKQENKVLIVKAPNRKKDQKQFLGYEWSTRKGNEGIQYNGGETVNDIVTPLFDPKDPENIEKINTAIKRNFTGKTTDRLPEYCNYAKLTDMLDFSRTDFNKSINLNPQQNTDIETKWERKTIHNLLREIDGHTTQIQESEILKEGETAVITQEQDLLISGYTDKKETVTDLPLIIFGDHSCTFKYIDFPFIRGADGTQLLKVDENELIPKYFYYLLLLVEIPNRDKYERHFKYLRNLKIPIPLLAVQQQIVNECETVDQETDEAREAITTIKQEIEEKLQAVVSSSSEIKKLEDIADIKSGGTPSRKNNAYWKNGLIPWLRSEVCKETHINENIDYECITEEGLGNSSAKWLTSDTTLIALVGATKGKTAFLTFEATTNQNIAGIKSLSKNVLDIYIFYCLKSLYNRIIQDLSQYDMLNLTEIKNIRIPIPTLNVQQQFAVEVGQLEAEITQAQAIIDNAPERKNAILTKYL